MDAIAQLNIMLARCRGDVPSAADILGRLSEQGVRLEPTDDAKGIRVTTGKLDDEQRTLVKQHKEAILDHLTAPGMKFDFLVPEEANVTAKMILVRMRHHEWPACDISRKKYGRAQDEFDAAFLDSNGERFRRAAETLHAFMDREPFSLNANEGRIWFEPRNADLAGLVRTPAMKKTEWRVVCRGVPEHNRDLLERYLGEYTAEVDGSEVKVDKVK